MLAGGTITSKAGKEGSFHCGSSLSSKVLQLIMAHANMVVCQQGISCIAGSGDARHDFVLVEMFVIIVDFAAVAS
jgi:hypothetical protein